MKTKYMLAILAIAIIIFAVGCEEKDKEPTGSEEETAEGRFIGGDEGLTISFLEGAPPAAGTYDGGGNNFGIAVEVENVGEADVAPADTLIEVYGFSPSDFSVANPADLKKQITTDLQGKDMDPQGNIQEGARDIVDFGSYFDYAGTLSGNSEFTIKAALCSKYMTYASTNLCVRKDLLDPRERGAVCEPNEDKTIESSGAPVKLDETLVHSVSGRNKISFAFTITKADEEAGEVYRWDDVTTNVLCDTGLVANQVPAQEDMVYVDVNTGMSEPGSILSCTGLDGANLDGHDSGYVKLYGTSRLINCVQDIPETALGDYTKELKIELTYEFKQYADDATLLVRHI